MKEMRENGLRRRDMCHKVAALFSTKQTKNMAGLAPSEDPPMLKSDIHGQSSDKAICRIGIK